MTVLNSVICLSLYYRPLPFLHKFMQRTEHKQANNEVACPLLTAHAHTTHAQTNGAAAKCRINKEEAQEEKKYPVLFNVDTERERTFAGKRTHTHTHTQSNVYNTRIHTAITAQRPV